jgi:hypothetical protein
MFLWNHGIVGVFAAFLLCLLWVGVESAHAGNVPVSAWATIDDGFKAFKESETVIKSSLNGPSTPPTGSGYIVPTDPPTITGPFPLGASAVNTQEAIGTLGAVDMHFEYQDSTPLAPGQVFVVNFDILESPSGPISDTLSVTVTGHAPGGSDMTNTSVDLHFLSDSLDGILPPGLVNPIFITENGLFQDVSQTIHDNTGLSDLHVRFASDVVPEPSSLALLAIGLTTVTGYGWRRWKRQA